MKGVSWGVIAASLLLSGCSEKAQVNYRITVEVDDNGVTRTGTGVWSVEMQSGGFPDKFTSRFRGEAIPVDLGEKGTLFVLIAGRSENGSPEAPGGLGIYGRHLFGDVARRNRGEPQKNVDPLSETREFSQIVGKSALLDCSDPPTEYTSCPFMVRFRDIRDPKTVEAVDPNNLGATFGQGVKLRPLKISISDESVTVGIAKQFVWWAAYSNRHFDGSSTSYQDLTNEDVRASLSDGYFSTEISK
jgi:hypothetical protein